MTAYKFIININMNLIKVYFNRNYLTTKYSYIKVILIIVFKNALSLEKFLTLLYTISTLCQIFKYVLSCIYYAL